MNSKTTSRLLALVSILAFGCGGDEPQPQPWDTGSPRSDVGHGEQDVGASDVGPGLDTGSGSDAALGDTGGGVDMGTGNDASSSTDAGTTASGTSYIARRDRRRCPAPDCGGWWLSEANSAETMCADGAMAAECYVAQIDWSTTSYDPNQVSRAESAIGGSIFEGEISLGNVLGKDIGVFAGTAAWVAEWGAAIEDPTLFEFHSLSDDGSDCIAEPCFTIDVTPLNSSTTVEASAVDLEGTSAEPDDLTAAEDALNAGILRAAGTLSTDVDPGPNGNFGETYQAQQFYLPL